MDTTERVWTGVGIVFILVLLLVAGFGCTAGLKSFNRYQDRQDRNQTRNQQRYDAENQVRVNNIRIGYFKQEDQITKQQAQIRFDNAVGIRRSQDEIAKTLTPRYIQFEMIDAMKAIATSGKNNSIIYVPAGQAGVPVITANAGVGK